MDNNFKAVAQGLEPYFESMDLEVMSSYQLVNRETVEWKAA